MINKKAVSEVVSYTLLIIIAVGLSVAVYSFLKVYVPKDRINCQEDISIVVQDVSCTIGGGVTSLNITLKNKGLFNVTDAYVRVGAENRKVRSQINQQKTSVDLAPGVEKTFIYSASLSTGIGNNILEVQPAILTEKGLAMCNNAVVTETISCVPA